MTVRPILDVLNAHTARLMAIPGVEGTAQGELDGKPCVIIYVNELDDRLRQQLPGALEGHPVKIEEVGEIRPLD